VGADVFPSYEAGVAAMVWLERHIEPDAQQGRLYAAWFERYRPLWPLVREYLKDWQRRWSEGIERRNLFDIPRCAADYNG